MMAAAEARAAWQRTANRCFVQEDAKRAPKIACCSSSSSCKLHPDASNGDAANGPDHPAAGFTPLNWNPTNTNLPPDTKWWLQLQPNFACQKEYMYEQLSALEVELEGVEDGDAIPTSKLGEDPHPIKDACVDLNKNTRPSLESRWRVSAACMKHDSEARVQELKAASTNTQQPLKHKAGIGEYPYQDEDFMDWEPVDRLISNDYNKACLDSETPWIGGNKTEPWWRTADKDELASLVAQKSLEHIENCDLPRPQAMHVRRGPFSCLESFNHDAIISSSLDPKMHTGLCNPIDYAQHSPASGSMDRNHWLTSEVRHLLYDSEKPYSGTHSYSTSIRDPTDSRHTSDSDPSKAQLLEALRHSQTRAREAEKAAQQAYTEKEHIIKLFFRQASHLFAYKQWLQLLQLETLLLQLKAKDQRISDLFPVLPWMPLKASRLRKGVHKATRRKASHQKYDIGKYAVALAVGLGLAGAGLLLGWTMGWLLPSF
ncbi:uncharacterized protein LOC131241171 [Magnolia sinica]|uniref:uncharacterized protein LOC131241171 n=1 Tax=Magnolia sinica TaxID=86752 RepID=UPI00265B4429|nr:uncharacterized protein LOC131241171 [Magnolia sinica]XP_058095865.1 uncharacterized protein LOC131241171 [Magnolia sinica]XP_058095866.1 uncharacterized protein LOC131241171 [Magnolia sinica]